MRVMGVVGWKDNGKTTLVERLVAYFVGDGLRVATIKHAHHDADLDQPGKDTWRHREAGASEVILATGKRWALLHELRDTAEPELDELLTRLSPADIVLVEGFKRFPHAKIEAHRGVRGTQLIAREDATIVAIASDVAIPDAPVPVFDLDDVAGLAAMILARPAG